MFVLEGYIGVELCRKQNKQRILFMNKQNTFALKIEGNKQCFGYLEALNTFRFSNNRRFPTSYISFVKQYGYGLTANNFHIYIPLDTYGDSLFY